MKLQDLFTEYAQSHKNPTNISIHFICVPLIFASILGMLSCININGVQLLGYHFNWVLVAVIAFVLQYYIRLSLTYSLVMLLFITAIAVACYNINQAFNYSFYLYLAVFVLSWVGQFIGHNIEGKKPSFLKDLQFLLIGPLWVMAKLLGKKA